MTWLQGGDRHDALVAVRTQQTGLFRGFIEQGVDSSAGAVHRIMLDGARGAEEEKEEDAFLRVADDPGTAGGEQHQQVDVDAALTERRPGVDRCIPTAGKAGEREECGSTPGPLARWYPKVTASERRETQNSAGQRQDRNFFPFTRGFVVHAILLRAKYTCVNLATMDTS